jgi:hypothetical protein
MSEVNPALVPALNLRAIYVRKSSTSMADGFDPLVPGQQIGITTIAAPIGLRTSTDMANGPNSQRDVAYGYDVEFAVTYHLNNGVAPVLDESTVVARITVTYTVDYVLTSGAPNLSDEQIQSWGASQPMVHAWGHWREYCQSTMMRMNLPVVMVPLLVIVHGQGPVAPPLTSALSDGAAAPANNTIALADSKKAPRRKSSKSLSK